MKMRKPFSTQHDKSSDTAAVLNKKCKSEDNKKCSCMLLSEESLTAEHVIAQWPTKPTLVHLQAISYGSFTSNLF